MIKRLLTVSLCLFVLVSIRAHAEGGCPPGQYPQQGQGWQACVPIPGNNQPANADSGQVFYNSWQAVATDTPKGILGTAVGVPERSSAEAQAITDCQAKGGTDCKLEVSYGNGCIAMVVGDKTLQIQGAPTKKKAEQVTTDKCNAAGNSSCKVYYSECSPPSK